MNEPIFKSSNARGLRAGGILKFPFDRCTFVYKREISRKMTFRPYHATDLFVESYEWTTAECTQFALCHEKLEIKPSDNSFAFGENL